MNILLAGACAIHEYVACLCVCVKPQFMSSVHPVFRLCTTTMYPLSAEILCPTLCGHKQSLRDDGFAHVKGLQLPAHKGAVSAGVVSVKIDPSV